MSKTVISEGDEGVTLVIKDPEPPMARPARGRTPVHVVYGGADKFLSDVADKFGRIALATLNEYAPDFAEFARAFQLEGHERLSDSPWTMSDPLNLGDDAARFARAVYERTVEKLRREPVEDFRVDFEDGYGFRSDVEEDEHAVASAETMGAAFVEGRLTPFCGFRIKSFNRETYERAIRTLEKFLEALLKKTGDQVPGNFCVTLPKVTDRRQVSELAEMLSAIEEQHGIDERAIAIELMIETPEALIDRKGRIAVRRMIEKADGRCTSVHFGAYDYTSALGISASHQDIRHPACIAARQLIQVGIAGTGARLVDSVTTVMPVPVHRGAELSEAQKVVNKAAVHAGWRRHFANISASMSEGVYQSWDLHPNQLVARYAAVYAFFLTEKSAQAARLRAFLDKATKATMTGNTFDDAASANGLVNFFRRGRDCGAFDESELSEILGISASDLDRPFIDLIKIQAA